MNKKIRKLINNPGLFFKDMVSKKQMALRTVASGKVVAGLSYNIVIVTSSVLNNYKECFDSVLAQKASENINVIILNKDEPESDVTVYRHGQRLENCSFEAALSNEYTLFIWCQDLLDVNFIFNADRILQKHNKNNNIIVTNKFKSSSITQLPRNYHPFTAIYNKIQPLKVTASSMIVDSIYGTFFSTNLVKQQLVECQGYSWLNFDGLGLLCSVLGDEQSEPVIYISRQSKYLVSEELIHLPFSGTEWSQVELFGADFTGVIDIFYNNIIIENVWTPLLKRSLFFFLLKYIKKGLANQSLLDGCSLKEAELFHQYFAKALSIIGEKIISTFNVACAEQLKVGALNKIDIERFNSIVDILQYDEDKNQVLLRYFSATDYFESFRCASGEIVPVEMKTVSHNLFFNTFFYERRIWVCLDDLNNTSKLIVNINNGPIKFRGLNKKVVATITLGDIINHYNELKPKFKVSRKYNNAWILMDRDNQADDNAEHLYRYIKKNRPDIPAYFVISNESHDWERLEDDGFNLLAFGSSEHEAALESCSRVISSHAAQFATDYFKDKRMLSKKFVFLQHGVIHNDQSALFKPDWKKFDLFLTSSHDEYQSIAGEHSAYKFTAKEVALTGLPRHDALIHSDVQKQKMILVMPTWRPALLGKVLEGTTRELLPDFIESEYANKWRDFLSNERLKMFAAESGYEIVFFPHANIQPYLDEYILPEHVKVLSHAAGSIQELFLKASVMVTDYSSVAFEMAYLNKPVCYYQFDEEDFFQKGHYNKGYFDYRNDGFGPVFTSENNTIEFVRDIISNQCESYPLYAERVKNFFPFRDGNCCERVLNAILQLDEKTSHSSSIAPEDWAEQAVIFDQIRFAYDRYHQIFQKMSPEEMCNVDRRHHHNYCNVLLHHGDFDRAQAFFSATEKDEQENQLFYIKSNIIRSLTHLHPLDSVVIKSLSCDDYEYINSFISESTAKETDKTHHPIDTLHVADCDYRSTRRKGSDFIHSFISDDTVNLRILEIERKYSSAIVCYNAMDSKDREFIVNKAIYMRSLRALNKWALIIDFAKTNVLQGRTGIHCFASAYLYAMRCNKKIAPNFSDFDYVLSDVENIDFSTIKDFLYYCFFIKNYKNVDVIIARHFREINTVTLENYCTILCREKRVSYCYEMLKSIPFDELSIKGLTLLGEMALLNDEFDISINSFKRASLLNLPKVDKNLQVRLNYAMSCERDFYERKSLVTEVV